MIKHRKLHPTSKDNTTLSCPDICDSACPYGCDTYTGVYSLPPPPPLPSQASPSLSAKRSEHISPFLIGIITLLASCSIVITYYFIMVKFCSRWKPFRPWQRQPEAINEEFLDEIHGRPAIDHPIWYINTIGLQPSIIDSITIFRYKKGDDLIEGTECSVCLNEFQNDDTLRLLPKCSHAFHIPCIDTWLRSHINCPVCRAGIVSTIVTGTHVASNGLNSNHMILDEDSPVENSENEEDLNINRVRNDETSENRMDTGEIIEFPHVDNDELGDKRMLERENNEMQPVKRSISVDSFLAANISDDVINLFLAGSKDISLDQIVDLERVSRMRSIGGYSRTGRNVDGRSSIAQFLHKSPVRMKRSSSYAAGRSFLSRQRTRTNSLLPL